MKTGFLNAEEVAQVQSIMAGFGLDSFDASVRLWGRGKAIEVSGNLDSQQLSCLLAIAKFLNDKREEAASEDSIAGDSAELPIYAPGAALLRAEAQF